MDILHPIAARARENRSRLGRRGWVEVVGLGTRLIEVTETVEVIEETTDR